MTSPVDIECLPYGDSAVLVRTMGGDRQQRWSTVQALTSAAQESAPPCVIDTIAAYETLLIQIEAAPQSYVDVAGWVQRTHHALDCSTAQVGRVIEVPVVYGGDRGPDLLQVATELGMATDELISRHTATVWTVRMLGSPVGAPMMDVGHFPAPVKRCQEPRTAVPPGSVALAGQQCVIYPVRSPGGWRLIGQTPLQLTDVTRTPPTQHRPGDVIRFRSISEEDWGVLEGQLLQVTP